VGKEAHELASGEEGVPFISALEDILAPCKVMEPSLKLTGIRNTSNDKTMVMGNLEGKAVEVFFEKGRRE